MEKNDLKDLQRRLFFRMEARCGNTDLVHKVGEFLNLGKSAAYGRINGDVLLKLDELVRLMQQHNLSFDDLVLGRTDKIQFRLQTSKTPIRSFEDYLKPLSEQLKRLVRVPDLRIWYSTNEVPFFQYMFFRELSLFKLFAWGVVNWKLPFLEEVQFDPDSLPESQVYEKYMTDMAANYNKIKGIEFWTTTIFDNTIGQIKYFWRIGRIKSPEVRDLLFGQIEKLQTHQKAMAVYGKKLPFLENRVSIKEVAEEAVSIDLYHNEITPTNLTFLLESDPVKSVYTVLDNPNYMVSDEEKLYSYTMDWMEKLKTKSYNIVESESERNRFFAQLSKRTQTLVRL